jgi:hypothetical protein
VYIGNLVFIDSQHPVNERLEKVDIENYVKIALRITIDGTSILASLDSALLKIISPSLPNLFAKYDNKAAESIP